MKENFSAGESITDFLKSSLIGVLTFGVGAEILSPIVSLSTSTAAAVGGIIGGGSSLARSTQKAFS